MRSLSGGCEPVELVEHRWPHLAPRCIREQVGEDEASSSINPYPFGPRGRMAKLSTLDVFTRILNARRLPRGAPAVYEFGLETSNGYLPIYVGSTCSIQKRTRMHLTNSRSPVHRLSKAVCQCMHSMTDGHAVVELHMRYARMPLIDTHCSEAILLRRYCFLANTFANGETGYREYDFDKLLRPTRRVLSLLIKFAQLKVEDRGLLWSKVTSKYNKRKQVCDKRKLQIRYNQLIVCLLISTGDQCLLQAD
jgi:hypothetical protein